VNPSIPQRSAARQDLLVAIADLAGTFVFPLEGAFAAIGGHLDLFGVMVLAFATALGGGVLRDVLIGFLPPSALRGWSYATTAFSAAAVAFVIYPYLQIPPVLLTTLDAEGLAVGGGTIRDVLLAHVPAILRVDVYATAALLSATVLVVCRRLGLSAPLAAMMGGCVLRGQPVDGARVRDGRPTERNTEQGDRHRAGYLQRIRRSER
jgi:uncharacterized membrane protein YeiH